MNTEELVWERIPSAIPLCRTPIFGGWLVLQPNIDENNQININKQLSSISFVSDPEHKWNGGMHIFPKPDTYVRKNTYTPKELVFDKQKAITLGRSSGAFRHYRHVENTLNKFLRETKSNSADELSKEWYKDIISRMTRAGLKENISNITRGLNELSFTREVPNK